MSSSFVEEGLIELIDRLFASEEKSFARYKAEFDKQGSFAKLDLMQMSSSVNMQLLLQLLRRLVTSVTKIENAIEQLPDIEEYNKVKEELQKHRDTVITSLIPIKELADEWKRYKEQQTRGNDIYD